MNLVLRKSFQNGSIILLFNNVLTKAISIYAQRVTGRAPWRASLSGGGLEDELVNLLRFLSEHVGVHALQEIRHLRLLLLLL